jgi:hypothetical protein
MVEYVVPAKGLRDFLEFDIRSVLPVLDYTDL